MQYRADQKRDLRQIANELGFTSVLEGTVRRQGNNVRVSTALVDARNDTTIWADSYDRDLNDIFAIQSEVAQTIAGKLTATLSPEEKQRIEAKPTENLEAYDLYLRANELIGNAYISIEIATSQKPLLDAIGLLEQAVRLDPKFTLAYCASAEAHDMIFFADHADKWRSSADAAIDNALAIQPDLPEVHLAYATHLYRGYRNFVRARVQLEIAMRGLPNSAKAIALEGLIDRGQGDFEKAIEEINRALQLDPRNPIALSDLATTLVDMRRFAAAEEAYNRLIDRVPDNPSGPHQSAALLAADQRMQVPDSFSP
jgi:tetratricopeptide (TPR) repeat protein